MDKVDKYVKDLNEQIGEDNKKGEIFLNLVIKASWTLLGATVIYVIGRDRGYEMGELKGRRDGYMQGVMDFGETLLEEAKKRGK